MVGVVTASLAAGVCTFISPPVLHAAIANTFTGAPAWSTTRSQHAQEAHEKKLDSRTPRLHANFATLGLEDIYTLNAVGQDEFDDVKVPGTTTTQAKKK